MSPKALKHTMTPSQAQESVIPEKHVVQMDIATNSLSEGDVVAIRGDLRKRMDGTCQYTADQLVDGKYLKHTGNGGVWTGAVDKIDGNEALVGGAWRHFSHYEVMRQSQHIDLSPMRLRGASTAKDAAKTKTEGRPDSRSQNRKYQPGDFTHQESDLKPGDYFLCQNFGTPVAFQFGEIETRDGDQGMGITRLWDGSPYDLFRMNPGSKIRIVSREEAIACAKGYREATT